jgi:hypothetical protein
MKDKSFKVSYTRTESGGITVWIHKDDKLFAEFVAYGPGSMYLELGDTNNGHLDVWPHNATHRDWWKEVCSDCGWESQPHEGAPMGPGGTLSCPECEVRRRNGPRVENSYGNVHAVQLDWKTKQPLIVESHFTKKEDQP